MNSAVKCSLRVPSSSPCSTSLTKGLILPSNRFLAKLGSSCQRLWARAFPITMTEEWGFRGLWLVLTVQPEWLFEAKTEAHFFSSGAYPRMRQLPKSWSSQLLPNAVSIHSLCFLGFCFHHSVGQCRSGNSGRRFRPSQIHAGTLSASFGRQKTSGYGPLDKKFLLLSRFAEWPPPIAGKQPAWSTNPRPPTFS